MLIHRFSLFCDALSESTLELKPAFLENPAGGRIGLEHPGLESDQIEGFERPSAESPDRYRNDAAAPEGLTQPVADLGGTRVDIFTQIETDASDNLVGRGDREVGEWILDLQAFEPLSSLVQGVGVGKAILELQGDARIVGVADNRFQISGGQRPDLKAVLEIDFQGPSP